MLTNRCSVDIIQKNEQIFGLRGGYIYETVKGLQ